MPKENISHSLKMRELEKLTEFSRATINFYIREGILPLPQKSAKNMAYYDDDFVKRLTRIRDLKKSGYSLGQIRRIMNAKQGEENELILQALNNINRLLPSDTEESTVTREQIRSLGYADDKIDDLIRINLITPLDEEHTLFASYSLTICRFIKYFLDYGIPIAVAKEIVEKLMDVTHLESEAFIKYIRYPMIEKNASLEEQNAAIQNCIEKINTLLPLIHLQLLKLPVERLYLLNARETKTSG